VSDAVTLARTARESLARGLSALQGDPAVPPQLLELAAPIAQSMGALSQLQAQPWQHPVITAAMEAVAGALGSVHALTRIAAAPAAQPRQQPAPAAYPQAYAPPQQQYAPAPAPAQYAQAASHPGAPYASPQAHQPYANAAAYAATALADQAPQHAAPQQSQQPRQHRPSGPPQAGGKGAGGAAAFAAELWAHSQTNFYKGLSGNDIIDHGGLFVSTYKIPKIGQPVRLKVSLPGGYEFEANAVVRWCREQSEAGNDAPPGFGAQFVEITPEARQLVYRYVRNREPMFHDDL
jgi:Tfp pilus assembly protein PilZ